MSASVLGVLALAWMPAAEPTKTPPPPPSAPPQPVIVQPVIVQPVIVQTPTGPLVTFSDHDGAHSVRFTLADAPPSKVEDGRGRVLTVVHERAVAGRKAPLVVWTAKDFVLDCPFDVTLELIDGSIRVTDLDTDGTSEVSFAYALSCKSDVSPDDMKLLLYEGATKYALRGTRATFAGAVDDRGQPVPIGGGAPTPDPAFASAPPAFLRWALSAWDALQPPPPAD